MKSLLALLISLLSISYETAEASLTCKSFFHVSGRPHQYAYAERAEYIGEKKTRADIPSCDLLRRGSVTANMEKDEIFSLLAMTMVERDWQTGVNGRGHNIGSILVDNSNKPVFWARNTIRKDDDATQHGEVRLMQGFLKCPGVGKHVKGYSVYTTLEPCAMCAGMLAMTQVDRVIYLQRDPAYGGIGERLKSSKYPRTYEEDTPNQLTQKNKLDHAFEVFQKENDSITDFLLTDEAHWIFVSAGRALAKYQISHPENEKILNSARAYLAKITKKEHDEQAMEVCQTFNDSRAN
ncbi:MULTISPECIES: nucleoside deaminase [unclassified Pseudomonas]|uniref:nucleoside deaminase n=1 Tax=unclassified Pseudomonas TaxID=196821 RepID=UPI0011AF7B4B|nr:MULTISPECIES: deaminase [unclassified Pseudomonas]